jgi:glycosyltransferase involved in cell wall biosynthesis
MAEFTTTLDVVIPSFNGAQWIGQSIDSILAQTFPVRQIIVVDNHSTDQTREIVAVRRGTQIDRM